jgi:transposase
MFVRVKTTPNSPRKSVQIVASRRRGDKIIQKIIRHVGIAWNDYELEKLKLLAESIRIKLEADGQELLFSPEEIAAKSLESKKKIEENNQEKDYKVNLKNVEEESRVVSGIHDVYGKLFDDMGYGEIIANPARNEMSNRTFKDIVLARLANPLSKRASVLMLEEDFGVSLNLDCVYGMMDKLDDKAIARLNKISYENTKQLYNQKINVIFFDCTTLYFEAFEEDDLRKLGYSKDLKFNQVQVLLTLLVTEDGLPIAYEAFDGATYEGHTLIPILKTLRSKYEINKVIFVADSGLMNEENLTELEKEGFEYIVGCRIKSLNKTLKSQILNGSNYQSISLESKVATFNQGHRQIIVNYEHNRAKKDEYDRKTAIEKLLKKLKKEKNPKNYISNYGYQKYLKLDGLTKIELNEEKIIEDAKWDGLLGVITNAKNFSYEQILDHYRNLWQVEESFRITKHDLKVRPIYHWKPSRVRAHLAIAFTAYSLARYLEYKVKLQYIKLSPEVIRQTLMHVQKSIIFDKQKKIRYALPSRLSEHAKKIYKLCNLPLTATPYIIKKL